LTFAGGYDKFIIEQMNFLSPYKLSRKRFNGGFSLLEILLAIGILAFALGALLTVYVSCFSLVAISKNTDIATSVAISLAERIRNTPFTQIAATFNNFRVPSDPIVNLPSGRVFAYVSNISPTLLQVTISVCWRQGTRIFGEDTNLNGFRNLGEDANGNGMIDSPVQIVMLVVR